MISTGELRRQIGRDVPTGSFTIVPFEHRLMCDVIGGDVPADGIAHPMYAYFATLAGMGVTLPELFSWFGAVEADGVMAGIASIELHEPLRLGATYQVPGTIVDVERKRGRRLGTFDLMVFRLELVESDREVAAAAVENTFVFPRREGSP